MNLRDLTKPQWDAAREAAQCLSRANPYDTADRSAFREARDHLASLLPAGTDVRSIITQAVQWASLDAFAAVFGGLTDCSIEAVL